MIKLKDYKFFLFTGPTNIKFEAIDVNNEIYFSYKYLIDNSSSIENLDILEKFIV